MKDVVIDFALSCIVLQKYLPGNSDLNPKPKLQVTVSYPGTLISLQEFQRAVNLRLLVSLSQK